MLVERRALALSCGRLCFNPQEAEPEGLLGLAKKASPGAVASTQAKPLWFALHWLTP